MKAKELFPDIKTSIEIKKLNVAEFKIIYRLLDVNGNELHHGHSTKKVNSLNPNHDIKIYGDQVKRLNHFTHLKEVIKKYFPEELI